MDNKELLGKRIKELRKARNFKQEFLAEKLDIETRQLSKLETGKHYPSFETIVKILNVFEISFEELINFKHLQEEKIIRNEALKMVENLDEERLKIAYKFLSAITK